ncbi:MAG: hypothetical protein ACE5ED_06700 [Rhodothalassiaceae bacterium]
MPGTRRSEGLAGAEGRIGTGRDSGPAPGGAVFVLLASAIAWGLILAAILA